MTRLAVLVTAALAGIFPASARADRSYGAASPPGALAAFRLSDSGRALKAATMRFELPCAKGGFMTFAGTLRIVGRPPAKHVRGEEYLVRGRGSLDRRLIARWGTRRSFAEYSGRVRIDRVRERSARVRLAVRLRDTDAPGDPCRVRLSLRAQRDPGVLYTGATSDEEPIWLRRQGGDTLEAIAGYGNDCRPGGFMEGLFFDVPPLAADGSFGWSQDTAFGRRNGFRTHGTFAGRLGGAAARGTLRLIGTDGPGRADRCDTGLRTWTATSE